MSSWKVGYGRDDGNGAEVLEEGKRACQLKSKFEL